MIPTPNHSHSSRLIRTSLVFFATLAMVATITLLSGEGVAKEHGSVTVPAESISVVLDAAVFGSSAGQASFKSAPTTWSSRSKVRWNARWASEARYLV